MTISILERLSKSSGPLHFLATQWEQAREGALLPRRDALTARRLIPILPLMAIYECRSPEEILFRLCGSNYSEMVGGNLTGKNIIDLAIGDDNRRRRIERWGAMLSLPCGAIAHGAVPQQSGNVIRCDTLFLPVAPDEDSAPLQFMSVIEEVAASELPPEVQEAFTRRVQIYSDDFVFVDIGRGVP